MTPTTAEPGDVAGVATVTEAELADLCGMTVRQVRRHIATLEAAGYVVTLGTFAGRTTYALTFPEPS